MSKDTTLFPEFQESEYFSAPQKVKNHRLRFDFNAPDISSNGGLLLAKGSLAMQFIDKLADLIPDERTPYLVRHSMREMIRQRVGQIACGYEDANDCDALRRDSALKMLAGRLPSDDDLCSQPTMTRLENSIDSRTLYRMGEAFVKQFADSFTKAPRRIIVDVDDTNANTYGCQELTLFNDYYGEYCYMPLLIFDGLTGKMILPLLRPGRRNKSANVASILKRVVKYLRVRFPRTIVEVRGDSHFCSHELMEWSGRQHLVHFTTGLAGNKTLLAMVDKMRRRAEGDYRHHGKEIRRYYDFEYKAGTWEKSQRVVAKIEANAMGTNIRFVVSSNRNNSPEKVYRHYCERGTMELWIKDLKYLHGDRMSCSSFKANQFRLFLHAAAYTLLHQLKCYAFDSTEVAGFTLDTFVKRIMLSAVHIVEKKCSIIISFAAAHRHRQEIERCLGLQVA